MKSWESEAREDYGPWLTNSLPMDKDGTRQMEQDLLIVNEAEVPFESHHN